MTHRRGMWFIVLMILGIFSVMQFRTVINNKPVVAATSRDLALRLDTERTNGRDLLAQLSELEKTYADKLKNLGDDQDNDEFNSVLQDRNLEYFRAGFTGVRGQGIVITMNDAMKPGEMSLEEYIIHDSDITTILNELRIAGAQAISINGERVLGHTKTVCAGPTILINKSRYPVPYEFRAIGEAQKLFDALDQSEVVGVLRLYDIRVDIKMESELEIGKFQIYNLNDLMTGLEVVTNENR